MIPREDHEEGRSSSRYESEAVFRESVGVEKSATLRFVSHFVLSVLVLAIEYGEVEVGGGVVDVPVGKVGAEERVSDQGGEGEG